MSTATEKWTMPSWMRKYRKFINNTGGNSVEELMNDDGTNSNVFNNPIRGMLCVAVKSQVAMLTELHQQGKIS